MTDYKKRVSTTGQNEANPATLSRIESLSKPLASRAKGIAGDPLSEGVPSLITTQTEKVIAGGNNASIVLGRDRPGSRLSGYGGAGYTQAGTIDIVVGRMGYEARSFINGERAWCNPSFEKDAARIYISQKTDVDRNFQLSNAKVGTADGKSAIALKADGIRIIGREGIKIITRCDSKNSQGGTIERVTGVDIIAGNDDSEQQPMVKGNQVGKCLGEICNTLQDVTGILEVFLRNQMDMNRAVSSHVHISPFMGQPTTFSPPVQAKGIATGIQLQVQAYEDIKKCKLNIGNLVANYLCGTGEQFILSRYHTLN